MLREARVQHVGPRVEGVLEGRERKRASADAVVAEEHSLQEPVAAAVEPAELRRALQGFVALRLRIARCGNCRAEAGEIHVKVVKGTGSEASSGYTFRAPGWERWLRLCAHHTVG